MFTSSTLHHSIDTTSGQTEYIESRLFRHRNSGNKSTKKAKDWILKHIETFNSRSEAVKRELEINSKKSRRYIESLFID